MGWMVVIFDIPVMTPEQRKSASNFRKFLLDDGFQMIQYSVYARACISNNRMKTHMRHLKFNIPENGHIRAFYITQVQWEHMYIIHGKENKRKQIAPEKIPEQLLLFE